MKRLIDITCPSCEWKGIDQWLTVGEYPACPTCGSATERLWSGGAAISDDIPGGLVIDHFSSTPQKFYSKSAIAAEAKRRGLVSIVEHVPEKGSDKSPHTTRWI